MMIASLSPFSTAIFLNGPRLAGTRMSPLWILLELRMTKVVVTAGAIRCAKLQPNRHHQQINTQFLQAGCPPCRPTNSVRALREENVTFHGLAHTKFAWGLPNFSLNTKGSWLPWRRVAKPLISAVMPVPHFMNNVLDVIAVASRCSTWIWAGAGAWSLCRLGHHSSVAVLLATPCMLSWVFDGSVKFWITN